MPVLIQKVCILRLHNNKYYIILIQKNALFSLGLVMNFPKWGKNEIFKLL